MISVIPVIHMILLVFIFIQVLVVGLIIFEVLETISLGRMCGVIVSQIDDRYETSTSIGLHLVEDLMVAFPK